MRKTIMLLLVVSLLPALAYADPVIKGTPADLQNYLSSLPKEVTLIGEAKLEIQAESGIINVRIRTEDTKLQAALQKNQQIRSEVTSQLIKSGMARDKITGMKFSSTPEYGFFGKKPNNYVVDNSLNITVENEKQLQDVAEMVDSYKEVFYQGIDLKEPEKEEIRGKLMKIALANARERQKVYEAELGVVLKPIIFEEKISLETEKEIRRGRALYMAKEGLAASRDGDDNLSLGQQKYRGSVIIKYEVLPGSAK